MKALATTILILLYVQVDGQIFRELGNRQQSFVAGTPVRLSFAKDEGQKKSGFVAVFDNGTVRIMVPDSGNEGEAEFIAPEAITRKSGSVIVRLFAGNRLINTSAFVIKADSENVRAVESYCGPKHLVADRGDYSMIVSTALDRYGNPIRQEDTIRVVYQQQNQVEEYDLSMRPLFGYRRLNAGRKTGYGTVVAMRDSVSGKSFRLDFYHVDPLDFSVKTERQHQYADGDQVVALVTSPIRGISGDPIGNGTMVRFIIRDSKGKRSHLQGYTVDGVARAIRYAPEEAVTWQVEAVVPGYASSKNTEVVTFLPSVTGFSVRTEGESVLIGPVKGYLGQWVKKGMRAEISIVGDTFNKKIYKVLEKGRATVSWSQMHLPVGRYVAKVTISGITEQTEFEIQ